MRITEQMLSAATMRSLGANLSSLADIQRQVSTTKRLNKPSDDPADVRTAVTLKEAQSALDQYLRNIEAASRTVTAADGALGSAGDDMQRIKEIALEAANGSTSATGRGAVAEEVEQLAAHLAQLAGTKVGDQYIFSGFRTDIAPYATPPAGTAAFGAYLGDAGTFVARIAPGATVQINLTADSVFGSAFAALQALDTELRAGNPPSAATLAALDTGLDDLLRGRAIIGARTNRLDETKTTVQDMELSTKELLSDTQDVDMAAAITELTQRQTVYEAALKTSGAVLGLSLIDELR